MPGGQGPVAMSRAEVAGIEPTGRGSPVPLVLKTRGPTRRPFTSANLDSTGGLECENPQSLQEAG